MVPELTFTVSLPVMEQPAGSVAVTLYMVVDNGLAVTVAPIPVFGLKVVADDQTKLVTGPLLEVAEAVMDALPPMAIVGELGLKVIAVGFTVITAVAVAVQLLAVPVTV